MTFVSRSISHNSKQFFNNRIPGSCSKNAVFHVLTVCACKQSQRETGPHVSSSWFKSQTTMLNAKEKKCMWWFLSKHGFMIHWLISYTDECSVRLSVYLYVCVCERYSKGFHEHAAYHITSNDTTVYFSWNQDKSHVYYLQLCTVCVCVHMCVCALVCVFARGLNVKLSGLSGDNDVAISTGGQHTDPSGGRGDIWTKKKLWRRSQGALVAVNCGYVGWSITAVVEWAAKVVCL